VLEEAKQTIEFTPEERASYFNRFQTDVSSIELPSQFTFPFYYDPHPLCLQAIEELKPIINQIPTSVYDFGFDSDSKQGIGKMFGVLVVQNEQGELGYLVAFSGKLGPYSHQHPFVPPVFNRLAESGYFKQVEANINQMNASIKKLEASEEFASAQKELEDAKEVFSQQVSEAKAELKRLKKERKQRRAEAESTLDEIELAKFKKN
jgi:tRNA pseudouridine32 synthase/23S rRNA pseudouridine746 synthase